MDTTGFLILLMPVSMVAVCLAWWLLRRRSVRQAGGWPLTVATIESGADEVVTNNKYATVKLPVFAFSYQVGGQYYSGRFSLRPDITDHEAIIGRMIGRRVQVRYDPRDPAVSIIPDDLIDGCKVEQKMGAHLIHNYPRD